MSILSITLLAADAAAMGQDKSMAWEVIKSNDPWGITVALISISVVIAALIVLSTVIMLFSRLISSSTKRENGKSWTSKFVRTKKGHTVAIATTEEDHSGEIIAAISVAIKIHSAALHDRESEVITINSVARSYSPWSSKIYGLTRNPR